MNSEGMINTKKSLREFLDSVGELSESFVEEIINGVNLNSMALRVTRHVMSLIDWNNPWDDPIRKQFLPLAKEYEKDHEALSYDPLNERGAESAIVHRYENKVLFLSTKLCRVYCAFCTRSYGVGPSTNIRKKDRIPMLKDSRDELIGYLIDNPSVNDVVLSGGDTEMLDIKVLDDILNKLNQVDSVRSVRIATRGFVFDPLNISKGSPFFECVINHHGSMREKYKQLSIQSHFNHFRELNDLAVDVLQSYFLSGVVIRNQTVLLRGVNDSIHEISKLIDKLIFSGVTPYYIYQMDMVVNAEHFRVPIKKAVEIKKNIIGRYAGFNVPRFVVDLPGGGGKVDISSYITCDEENGVYEYEPIIEGVGICKYYDPRRIDGYECEKDG